MLFKKPQFRKHLICVIFICLISLNAYGKEMYWLNSTRTSADYEADYDNCRGMQMIPEESKVNACLMQLGWCPVTKNEIKHDATCGMGKTAMRKQADVVLKEFKELYKSVKIGMSKKQVGELVGVEPTDKVAVSTKDGVFECWSWNTRLGNKSVLFRKGAVVQIEISSCLDFM